MSINKFGMKVREKSHMSEYAVAKLIRSILGRYKFLNEAEEGYDAENKRLINLKTPIASEDAANKDYVDEAIGKYFKELTLLIKHYVDERIRIPYAMLLLTINTKKTDNSGFYIIEPYGFSSYVIHFAARVAIVFNDFTEKHVTIYLKGEPVKKEMYYNKNIFVEMEKLNIVQFKKKGDLDVEFLHCELLIKAYVEW